MEQYSQEGEEAFFANFKASYSGRPLIDRQGKFMSSNKYLCEILGYTEVELKSLTIADVTHPDDKQDTVEKIQNLYSGKISLFEVEKRYLKKNGEVIICHTSLSTPVESGGRFLFLTVSLTDITELKKSKEILTTLIEIQNTFNVDTPISKAFEKILRIILKVTQSKYGFFRKIFYEDGKPYLKSNVDSNTAWNVDISSYSQEAIDNWMDSSYLEMVLRKIVTTKMPVIVNDSNHDSGMGSFMGLPFYDNNKMIGMFGITNKTYYYSDKDISLIEPILATCSNLIKTYQNALNNKIREKEVFEINEEITKSHEVEVTELTMDLKNAKEELTLRLEKKIELSALNSSFASMASHQFRTPLAVIKSSLGLLLMYRQGKLDDFELKFDKTHERIKKQIDIMTDLMDDVLVFGEINSGSIKPVFAPTDLFTLCKEIVGFYNEIQKDGRTMKLTLEGVPDTIRIDKKLIRHAVSNLVSNAFKYSVDRVGPLFTVIFLKSKVRISVKDYGIGIPERSVKHLFDPFFRAINVGEISGTGLGTAIAKEYIELNGGTISVKSEVNKGSEFIIEFKRSQT